MTLVSRLRNGGSSVSASAVAPPGTVSISSGSTLLNSSIALSGVMVRSHASDSSAAAMCLPTPRRSGSCSPMNPCSSWETQTTRFSPSSTIAAHRLVVSTSIHSARRGSMSVVATASMTCEPRRSLLEERGDALEEVGCRGRLLLQPLLNLQLRLEIVCHRCRERFLYVCDGLRSARQSRRHRVRARGQIRVRNDGTDQTHLECPRGVGWIAEHHHLRGASGSDQTRKKVRAARVGDQPDAHERLHKRRGLRGDAQIRGQGE